MIDFLNTPKKKNTPVKQSSRRFFFFVYSFIINKNISIVFAKEHKESIQGAMGFYIKLTRLIKGMLLHLWTGNPIGIKLVFVNNYLLVILLFFFILAGR